jgi:hypothetical protein
MKRFLALAIAGVVGLVLIPDRAHGDVGLTLYLIPPKDLGGGLYEYDFSLRVNTNPQTWVPGQGYGGLIFGDVPSANAPSPLADFTMTSSIPGPWTGLGSASGYHNGPSFRPSTDGSLNPILWTPTSTADRLNWTGTSHTNTTTLFWSTGFTSNGATPAEFTPVVIVPEPSPLYLGLVVALVIGCVAGVSRIASTRNSSVG